MKPARFLDVLGGYPFALASVAAATGLLLPLRSALSPAQIMLLFVPMVAWIGRASGARPAVLAAALSVPAVAACFVVPYGSIAAASVTDRVTLAVFFAVTLFVGILAGALRKRARAALQRQREVALLNRLSSRLVSEKSVDQMGQFIANEVVTVLGASRAALYLHAGGRTRLVAEAGEPGSPVQEAAVADDVLRSGAPQGVRATTGAADAVDAASDADSEADIAPAGAYLPLAGPDGPIGVLYVRPLAGAQEYAGRGRQLRAVADLAAAFMARHALEEAAAAARATRESDRLKSTLVSSVSHELKTPLAAVTARLTGLLGEQGPIGADRLREELTAATEDLTRLDSSIRDLVDVSRLESDAWRPKLDTYELSEVLGTVANRVPVAQRSRVLFDIPPDLPPLRMDFAQIARAISNLVENGLAYTPAPEPVRVGARILGSDLIVWVEDRGPGVAEEEKEQVFEKFYRGTASGVAPAGTGLGLAIVREIVRSHGGRVWVEDASPSGARFVLSLPLEGAA
jgi:two-component system sensor histidine kinase KdpD